MTRLVAGWYLLLGMLSAALVAAHLIPAVTAQLAAVHDLTMESPTVNTILLLRAGVNVYSPASYDGPPFNVLIYPPAYHYLVAWLPISASSPYAGPRLVSATFMFLAGGLLLIVAPRRSAIPAAVLAVLVFFSVPAVVSNTAFARQDPMALFFAGLAVVLVSRSRSPIGLLGAGASAAIAVLTKQTYLSAALACAVYLLWWRRQDGLGFLGVLLALGAAFATLAQLAWGEGFWWSVLVAPRNGSDWAVSAELWRSLLSQWSVTIFLGVLAMVWGQEVIQALRRRAGELSVFAYYAPLTFLVLALTVWKVGAGANYFFEPIWAGLAYLVHRASSLRSTAYARPVALVAAGIAVGLLIHDAYRLPARAYSFTSPEANVAQAEALARLRGELASVSHGDARILFDLALVRNPALSLGTRLFVNDARLYDVLWREGKLERASLVAAIRGHFFDVIVVPDAIVLDRPGGEPYRRAVAQHYRRAKAGMFNYFVPVRISDAPHPRLMKVARK
jgi:hypothetical protein